jgi:predicted phosphodiesterase
MQRTKIQRIPSAILTADWHLREDTPTAFTGNFQLEQWGVVTFIANLQQQYNCIVYHAGDLFNNWKPSPWLITMAMRHLPDNFYTIYGNHDLPQHNLELADKCGINVLQEAGKLTVLNGIHWGQTPPENSSAKMMMWHVMTYQGKKPWPGCTDPMAASLLRKYPQHDLILTGHNHKTFVEEHEGRVLVNPGGITRQASDQIYFKPCVFLWYADTNRVEPVYLPYTEGAISREHIDVIEERDARIDAFISKLNSDWDVSLSFEDNIESFCQANNVREPIKEIIYKALEV